VTQSDIFKQTVVYSIPHMEDAQVKHDIVYKTIDGTQLTMDVYYPADHDQCTMLPAILFIHGDAAWEHLQSIKESGQYRSWCQLAAACGFIGITFTHRSTHQFTDMHGPTEDILDLFAFVQHNAADLCVDSANIGVWLCSAGGPTALTALLRSIPEWLTCVVSYYALMDLHSLLDKISDLSAETVEQFSAITHLKTNPAKVPPMHVVKAGLDRPHFNDSIDRFIEEAKRQRIPVELVTHPNGQHGFDLFHDDETSRKIIRDTLSFFKHHLKRK